MSTELAEFVLTRRTELGLTQDAAAQRAGVSVDTWRRVEHHGRCGDISLAGVAAALEADLRDLRRLRDTEDPTGASDEPLDPSSTSHAERTPRSAPMCRRCAQPVTTHGLKVRLVGRGEELLRVRAAADTGEASYWTVAHQAAYYCSIECMARIAVDNLYTFSAALEGPTIDLRT